MVGLGAVVKTAGNTVLKPAAVLFTKQRTSGITDTNAFSAHKWPGA